MPTFADLYSQLPAPQTTPAAATDAEPTFTISCKDLPLPEFCRLVAQETGVSVVFDSQLDKQTVTLEAKDLPLSQLLGAVARRAAADVRRDGSLYWLGQLRREDKGVLVRQVRGASPEDLRTAVNSLGSDQGTVAVYRDGTIIAADKLDALQRLAGLLDQIEQLDQPAWLVQYYLVSLAGSDVRRLGLETESSLDLAATFAAAASGGARAQAQSLGALRLAVDVARSSAHSSIVAEPLLLLRPGRPARIHRGERLPIRRVETIPDGPTTRRVETVEYVDSGLVLEAQLLELPGDGAALQTTCAVTTVLAESAVDAPVFGTEQTTTDCVLLSGGVYLLAAVERRESARRRVAGLDWTKDAAEDTRVLQVWCRVTRVAGQVAAPCGLVRLPDDRAFDAGTPVPAANLPFRDSERG